MTEMTTAQSIRAGLDKATGQLAERSLRPPRFPNYLLDPSSNDPFHRAYRTVKDKLGDIIRIYRVGYRERGKYTGEKLREIRARNGVGRPGKAEPLVMHRAIKKHGSQRKAAAALGISLGKLQRQLRAEQK